MSSGSRLRSPRAKVILVAMVVLLVTAALVMLLERTRPPSLEPLDVPGAPADLVRFRDSFLDGLEAIQEGQGDAAVSLLDSFSFGDRDVEQYRLYYLATAYQLNGSEEKARTTLAELWDRPPTLVYRDDVGFTLGDLYAARGSWRRAAEVFGTLASRAERAEIAADARSRYLRTKFYTGDPGAILLAAKNIWVENPAAPGATAAGALFRDLASIPSGQRIPLTPEERARRAVGLLQSGKPEDAVAELDRLDPASLGESMREEVFLQRGLAKQRLRRYEESNESFEHVASGSYRHAAPALFHASINYRRLAASITTTRYRVITEKVRSGTRKVRKGKKTVSRPVYKFVKKEIKLVDAAAVARQEAFDRLESERLKDVLQIPGAPDLHRKALHRLIEKATERNQDEYLQELVPQLIEIEPAADPALQRFWDKAWTAFQRGDLAGAEEGFFFIYSTYQSPNVRRQARYWYARAIERRGRREEAKRIYQQLADAPFEDLYARFATMRGATPANRDGYALAGKEDTWRDVAETEIPEELVLAYQLAALGAAREARQEVQAKSNETNRRFSDMILGELYFSGGSITLAHRYLRRAYPKLATVEQDEVPIHFLRMYYPIRYEESIRRMAARRELDPYLVMALIHQESAFDPDARSSAGARGLMQLMPATAKEIGRKLYGILTETRLDDPEVNIDLGTYYIRQLINLFNGDELLAVAGYNGGPYRIRQWRQRDRAKSPDEFIEGLALSETRNYVKRVVLLRSSYARFQPP
ncbi:MAG TPA: lytic transglycosylase domain-containing protein [Thermoanaerobaculia bacterium]|nr:lytic transglycosylase domain-containing protein [Thermoanaerobaculia bacterium]